MDQENENVVNLNREQDDIDLDDLDKETLTYIAGRFDEWDKLQAEAKRVNSSKNTLLDGVETYGVDRIAFKLWAKRRKWDTDKQQKFDFSLTQCRKASPAVAPEDEDEAGTG